MLVLFMNTYPLISLHYLRITYQIKMLLLQPREKYHELRFLLLKQEQGHCLIPLSRVYQSLP